MSKNNFIKFLIFAILIFFHGGISTNAGSDGLEVNLHIGSCNNNNICEVGQEDFFSCPADCTPIVVPPDPGPNPKPVTQSGSIVGTPVMDNVFNNLTVEVSYTSATIRWNSVIPTMSNVKWGINPDYRDGVLRNINFLLDHKVELTGLKEGTVYYFNIEAENLLGKTNTLENQVFRTLSLLDTTPPGNVTNVKAISTNAGITVSWKNPKDLDFDYVRVMRNDNRYYGSPQIGYLVYEGKGTYFTDSEVVAGKRYYYSIFSRDRAGNYSSGAMVDIIHNPSGKDTWGEVLTPIDKVQELPGVSFVVAQNSIVEDFKMGSIFKLSGDEPINIKTNYTSILKNDDLWVTIKNEKRGIIWQYFFSRMRDKDGYLNVNIPSFDEPGYYSVAVYKYSSSLIDSSSIIINQGGFQISKMGQDIDYGYIGYIVIGFICLIIILLLYLLYRYVRRRYEKYRAREVDSSI